MAQEPSAAQKTLADFAPKLAELTDKVLFKENKWLMEKL